METAVRYQAEMDEDCFLTMARSIVDEVLGRYGVELACETEAERARGLRHEAKAA